MSENHGPAVPVVITPRDIAAALSFGSLAAEYVRQPEVLPQFVAWLHEEGARGTVITPQDTAPRVLERYDVVLTELAYQHGRQFLKDKGEEAGHGH